MKKKNDLKKQMIVFKVNTEEFRMIYAKALMHAKGNLSKFVRTAALEYKKKPS